ncbi:hypothetical protein MASSI9I_50607 [Massilia sp. 9I]|nr:hypothetical protein MASSI9I_50607 [Massilia sp. 9I]
MGPLRHQRQCDLPRLHRHRNERGLLRHRAGTQADRHAAPQTPGQAGRPRRPAPAAGGGGGPFHQWRHHHGRRRHDSAVKKDAVSGKQHVHTMKVLAMEALLVLRSGHHATGIPRRRAYNPEFRH